MDFYVHREDRNHKPKSSQKRSLLSSVVDKEKDSPLIAQHKEESSPEISAGRQATESRSDIMDLRKRNQEIKRFASLLLSLVYYMPC